MSATASYNYRSGSRSYVGLGWAIGIHAVLLFLLLSGIFQTTVNRILKKPLEATVLQEVALPPLPVPQPKPEPQTAKPAAAPVQQQPVQAPVSAEAPAAQEAPAKAERAAEPQPVAAPSPVVAAHVAAPAPEVVHKPPSSASAEAEYAARLKALLNASKRYPTGRQASQQRPQGVVKLWFSLNRAGGLLEVGVLEPADSNLLNDAALATVRRAAFPPFAAELWPGQEQHRFTVDIDFLPPS